MAPLSAKACGRYQVTRSRESSMLLVLQDIHMTPGVPHTKALDLDTWLELPGRLHQEVSTLPCYYTCVVPASRGRGAACASLRSSAPQAPPRPSHTRLCNAAEKDLLLNAF